MTFELMFKNVETEEVIFTVSDIVAIRWITPSEVGLTTLEGKLARCRFKPGEKLEVHRKNDR